ncbi:MAG: flagellar hook basal-body protein [Acidobacteriota bacterium]|nr:flagellar hook basal-body protein [Acidobacteriota bacterium]
MDAISTSAASGMRARMESLEMLANNLANVETGGFKADREYFSVYTGAEATADPRTGEIPGQPLVQSHWTDLTQGNLLNTANPLDFAIDGDGLFAVQTKDGVRYTRNGNFRIGSAGLLSAADGSPVQAQGGGTIALQQGLSVEVLPDGTVQQGGSRSARSLFPPLTMRASANSGRTISFPRKA